MRQKNETVTSFNQLKEITQIMQAQKRSAQTSANANASKPTQKSALKPIKKAFSERQRTAFRDNSQASANKSQESKQADQQGDNANAFKSDEKNTRGQR
ncbi:hypothetical protein [Helicobacter pylori]|uniref:hypothetical protein n=1 Tax=Helicobacter pylori TaxID=210 RepID=UPI000C302EF8|nr:hypothetical protein [Helicobacter pylori]